MGIKSEIEEVLRTAQGSMSRTELAEALSRRGRGVSRDNFRKRLWDLMHNGRVVRDDSGLYHLGDGGGSSSSEHSGSPRIVEEEKPRHPKEKVPVPSDYEEFKELGKAAGVRDESLLEAICNYMLSGNTRDLNWVWEALAGMHLRNDQLHRWFRLWQGRLNLPIPPELARRIEQAQTGAGGSQPSATRWTVMGDQVFPDPDGEFEKPQDAFGFIEGRRRVEGALGQQTDPAELVRALSEIQTHYPQQTINWAEVMQALKPQFGLKEMLELLKMMRPPPPQPELLSRPINVITSNPEFISTALGMLRKGLGLDEIHAKLASISQQQAQPMIPWGEGGIRVPLYKELVQFDRDIRRVDNEERRADEAHRAKLDLYDALWEKVSEFGTAAQQAVDRLEQRQPQKQPQRQTPAHEPPEQP